MAENKVQLVEGTTNGAYAATFEHLDHLGQPVQVQAVAQVNPSTGDAIDPGNVSVTMRGAFGGSPWTLVDGNAIEKQMTGAPLPATVWVKPAAGDTVTVSYSPDNGTKYTVLAVITADWEDRFESGVTHIKFQRTAGTGVTSTCGVC